MYNGERLQIKEESIHYFIWESDVLHTPDWHKMMSNRYQINMYNGEGLQIKEESINYFMWELDVLHRPNW